MVGANSRSVAIGRANADALPLSRALRQRSLNFWERLGAPDGCHGGAGFIRPFYFGRVAIFGKEYIYRVSIARDCCKHDNPHKSIVTPSIALCVSLPLGILFSFLPLCLYRFQLRTVLPIPNVILTDLNILRGTEKTKKHTHTRKERHRAPTSSVLIEHVSCS